MRALARLVGFQRRDDVCGLLPGNLRHVVGVGKRGLVARNAMAADAHGVRILEALALRRLCFFFFRLRGDAERERGAEQDGEEPDHRVACSFWFWGSAGDFIAY